jgi:hypothetical protein
MPSFETIFSHIFLIFELYFPISVVEKIRPYLFNTDFLYSKFPFIGGFIVSSKIIVFYNPFLPIKP